MVKVETGTASNSDETETFPAGIVNVYGPEPLSVRVPLGPVATKVPFFSLIPILAATFNVIVVPDEALVLETVMELSESPETLVGV